MCLYRLVICLPSRGRSLRSLLHRLDHPHVADRAIAETIERRLITVAVIGRDRLFIAVELDHHGALRHARLPGRHLAAAGQDDFGLDCVVGSRVQIRGEAFTAVRRVDMTGDGAANFLYEATSDSRHRALAFGTVNIKRNSAASSIIELLRINLIVNILLKVLIKNSAPNY